MAVVHGGRLSGATVLEQESDVRREGADESERDADDESHVREILM
jgi:hypothetical protein